MVFKDFDLLNHEDQCMSSLKSTPVVWNLHINTVCRIKTKSFKLQYLKSREDHTNPATKVGTGFAVHRHAGAARQGTHTQGVAKGIPKIQAVIVNHVVFLEAETE